MKTIHIKYFASIREDMGIAEETLQTSALTLAELREQLIVRGGAGGGALARGEAVRLAVNKVMTDETASLADGCEVAFFPPVTGG
jgi:molybdopterin synthase sulfur carrier subunit